MMLDAHQRRLRRPSFAQIFDHIATVAPLGEKVGDRSAIVCHAYDVACAVETTQEYVDVHCHVWSADTFRECWETINHLGLVPLSLDRVTPAFDAWNEFTVSFVRI